MHKGGRKLLMWSNWQRNRKKTCWSYFQSLKTCHHSKFTGPTTSKPYTVPLALWDKMKNELSNMEALMIITPSISNWSCPVICVVKINRGIRLCMDYRKLNKITTQYRTLDTESVQSQITLRQWTWSKATTRCPWQRMTNTRQHIRHCHGEVAVHKNAVWDQKCPSMVLETH